MSWIIFIYTEWVKNFLEPSLFKLFRVWNGSSAGFNLILVGEIDNYCMNLTECCHQILRCLKMFYKVIHNHVDFSCNASYYCAVKTWDCLCDTQCVSQASILSLSAFQWLSRFSRKEWVDLMCSASHTSPGLTRQDILLKALARERESEEETLQDNSSFYNHFCERRHNKDML